MGILNAVQSVFSILIMISIGYLLSRLGWFSQDTPELFSKMVVRVSLPALMLSNLLTTFSRDMLLETGMGILLPLAIILILYGIGEIAVRVLRIQPKRRGIFIAMFAFSNTIFIGLPVNVALFGEESIPFVLLFYVANTVLFWTIGVYRVRLDGNFDMGSTKPFDRVKKILSPPLMGFLFAVVLILFDIKLPKFIMDTSRYIGNLTTPLSMIYMGIIVHSIKVRDIKIDKDMVCLLIGRFILAPLMTLALVYYLPVPSLMGKVFVIQAAMPAMTQTTIVSQTYKGDYKYATGMVTATTIASLIFIPLYMFILSFL
jgi:predicted permease